MNRQLKDSSRLITQRKGRAYTFIDYKQCGYYVLLSDGSESKLMPKSMAESYASMFGGKVMKAVPVYNKRFFGLIKKFAYYI